MDLGSALKKVIFFLAIIFPPAATVTHSVQYRYTALTPGINLSAVGLLDGAQFVRYDSDIRKTIPKTEWMKKISADDPDYWNSQSQHMQNDQENLKQLLDAVMKDFNHTEGIHTLMRTSGCELSDDGTTRGYDQISYDGEELISLDLITVTWTAANDKAVIAKDKWVTVGAEAHLQKNYLEKECIEWLKKFVSYNTETLEGKADSKDAVAAGLSGSLTRGEQAGIIIGVVLLVIAITAGLICCRNCRGHEGFIARADILEL